MLNRSVIFTLLVTALSLVVSSVQAQSHGNTYSGYRRSVGYMPPRVENAERAKSFATATEEEVAEPLPEEKQAVSVERSSKATWKTVNAVRDGQRSDFRTAYEEAGPVEVDPLPMEHCGNEDEGCLTCGLMGFCRPRCYWGRVEYLGWWKQGMRIPALVTENPTAEPALSNHDTVILFGNDSINKDAKSGGRFTLGMWADPCRLHGLQFTYLNLGTETASYHAAGDGSTYLGRPLFNIQTGSASAHPIGYPDSYSGWVNVDAKTKFQGTELLYRRAIKRNPYSQLDLLVGWRWLQLKDDLLISESVTHEPTSVTVDSFDRFNTKNNFHGVEFGIQWQRPIACNWTFEMVGKMALGNSHSVVVIDGQSTAPLSPNDGVLALSSNSGTHSHNSLSAITELGLSVKRRFSDRLEASFGYTIVYWGDVMRAGDQIDLNVDPRQIPPDPVSATHPAALMNTTNFWAQGLHFGLEYAF